MKKVFSIFLALSLLCLPLAGCSATGKQPDSIQPSHTNPPGENPPVTQQPSPVAEDEPGENPPATRQPSPVADDEPAEDGLLLLVNKERELPNGYEVELTAVGKYLVAAVLADELMAMRAAAQTAGHAMQLNVYQKTSGQRFAARATPQMSASRSVYRP